jgi:hypothetical protein
MSDHPLTRANGAPVAGNVNIQTAGARGPALLRDVWLLEKLAHFDREVIPELRMHAKGSGAYGHFTVTGDVTRLTAARLFSEVSKQTPVCRSRSARRRPRGTATRLAAQAGRPVGLFRPRAAPHRRLPAVVMGAAFRISWTRARLTPFARDHPSSQELTPPHARTA